MSLVSLDTYFELGGELRNREIKKIRIGLTTPLIDSIHGFEGTIGLYIKLRNPLFFFSFFFLSINMRELRNFFFLVPISSK